MHPVLFKIGSFELRSYGVMLVLGFYAGMVLAGRRAARYGLTSQDVMDSIIWLIGAGIIGARLFFIVQEWGYYQKHTNELLSLKFQGLTSFGGYVFGFIALVLWCRAKGVSVARMVDLLGPSALLANAIGRVGCLLNGCCYGHLCPPGTFGVHVDGFSGLYQPAQIYESAFNLVALAVLLFVESGMPRLGRSGGLALIFLGVCRFFYEFWRAGTQLEVNSGLASSSYLKGLPITDAQVMALLFVAFGAFWWWFQSRKEMIAETGEGLAPVQSLD